MLFLADRTLGGKVADVIPTSFAPGEIKFENKLFYGGEIRFQARPLPFTVTKLNVEVKK